MEFSQRFATPPVNQFLKKYAELRAELNLSGQIAPLLDPALRTGPLPDSTMVARQIWPDERQRLLSLKIGHSGKAAIGQLGGSAAS